MKTLEAALSESLPPGALLTSEPLSRHSTWGVGGPAAYFATADSLDVLVALLLAAEERELPVFVLGKGSNLLVSDEGYDGLVLTLGGALAHSDIDSASGIVTAGAGVALPALARECAGRGLSGLEALSGIPGSLGGAIRMNAGAFGSRISDIATSVSWLESPGAQRRSGRPSFSYRHCDLPGTAVVTSVTMQLGHDDVDNVQKRMKDLGARRRATQPKGRSAGSVFRNPEGASAGRLLESAGCKGLSVGAATVSQLHANFVVTLPGATSRDILDLIALMRKMVADMHGVTLEPEVTLLGYGEGEAGAGV